MARNFDRVHDQQRAIEAGPLSRVCVPLAASAIDIPPSYLPPPGYDSFLLSDMANLRAKKLRVQGKIKSTSANRNAGRSESKIKSSFQVHKESRNSLAEREEYLLGVFPLLLIIPSPKPRRADIRHSCGSQSNGCGRRRRAG